jgi:hypothetical protein
MYLAKFFHRPPGNDDREMLLILDSSCGDGHVLMGFIMDGRSEPYLRHDFTGTREAIAALRRATEELRREGYFETADTQYMLRTLPAHPKPKPAWQQGLDELMLCALLDDTVSQSALIHKLGATSAAQEPLYLWLAARYGFANTPKNLAGALARAENARDTLGARRASRSAPYTWSLRHLEIEAYIHDLLSEIHFVAGDVRAALDAAQHAQEVKGDQFRGGRIAWLLAQHFPEREDDAFDQAYRYSEFGGYEAVTELPAYAAYVARRRRKSDTDKGWRWGGRSEPASEQNLREAEQKLGAALPPDYRRFLATPRRTELFVRIGDSTTNMRFFPATRLVRERDNLFGFITRAEKSPARAEAYFRAQYGVSLRHLVPIAEPINLSSNIVIHLGRGDRYGWCYRWDHDGAWELEEPQPGFDAALAAFTSGIERRDATVLRFLGIHSE